MATDKKIPSNLVFSKEKFRYNTIQDVINDTGLTVGLVVETDGYNTLGDGFDTKYLITNVNEQGGILLKNGNYAKEIIKKVDKSKTYELYKNGVKTNVKVTIDENNNGIIISDDSTTQSIFSINENDVSNTTDLEDASIEINNKIEKNRNDISKLNVDLEQHKKGIDDVVELFSSDAISGQQGTIKLTETWKNFRKITIEIQTGNSWRSVRTFYTPIISVDDTPTIDASKFKYMLESYGDNYVYMMFRSNNIDIFVLNHYDYIHKILGIGRIAGF